jgi:hypothetical protein
MPNVRLGACDMARNLANFLNFRGIRMPPGGAGWSGMGAMPWDEAGSEDRGSLFGMRG